MFTSLRVFSCDYLQEGNGRTGVERHETQGNTGNLRNGPRYPVNAAYDSRKRAQHGDINLSIHVEGPKALRKVLIALGLKLRRQRLEMHWFLFL